MRLRSEPPAWQCYLMNAHRLYPLDILVLGGHRHGAGSATDLLMQHLRRNEAVRSLGSLDLFSGSALWIDAARRIAREGRANVMFIQADSGPGELAPFILEVRAQWPGIVFAFYTLDAGAHPRGLEQWESVDPRFGHYFRADLDDHPTAYSVANVSAVLSKCQEWHESRYDFDIVVSFAGQDRGFVRLFSDELSRLGARVFYDEYYTHELLGADLYTHLHEAYSKRSRYCVIIVSRAYAETVWAQHELRSAQERALRQGRIEYILPLVLEPVSLPGMTETTGYLEVNADDPITPARVVGAKLWPTSDLAATISGPARVAPIRIV